MNLIHATTESFNGASQAMYTSLSSSSPHSTIFHLSKWDLLYLALLYIMGRVLLRIYLNCFKYFLQTDSIDSIISGLAERIKTAVSRTVPALHKGKNPSWVNALMQICLLTWPNCSELIGYIQYLTGSVLKTLHFS